VGPDVGVSNVSLKRPKSYLRPRPPPIRIAGSSLIWITGLATTRHWRRRSATEHPSPPCSTRLGPGVYSIKKVVTFFLITCTSVRKTITFDMYGHMYVYMLCERIQISMYVNIYTYHVYVSMYIYIYIYIHIHTHIHIYVYTYVYTYTYTHTHTYVYVYVYVFTQSIACGVSFDLNLQSLSHWSLFNEPWQKRARRLDHRLRCEIEEITHQMPQAVFIYIYIIISYMYRCIFLYIYIYIYICIYICICKHKLIHACNYAVSDMYVGMHVQDLGRLTNTERSLTRVARGGVMLSSAANAPHIHPSTLIQKPQIPERFRSFHLSLNNQLY